MTQNTTRVGEAQQNTHTGLWDVSFEIWRQVAPGDEYLAATATSAAVFPTRVEALEAGQRALEILVCTWRYPNMCEAW
jgi:hypothetical protein